MDHGCTYLGAWDSETVKTQLVTELFRPMRLECNGPVGLIRCTAVLIETIIIGSGQYRGGGQRGSGQRCGIRAGAARDHTRLLQAHLESAPAHCAALAQGPCEGPAATHSPLDTRHVACPKQDVNSPWSRYSQACHGMQNAV